jgi:integrase
MAASKHPGPFWRKQTNCYYVQIGKKQHRLSSDKDEAYRLYHELMARPPGESTPAAPTPSVPLVVQLVDDFLGWVQCNRAADTYDVYHRLLQKFAEAIPKTLTVAELKPFHVTRVMDANSGTWSVNTKRNFAVTVQRVLNWAEKQGLVEGNPLRHVEKPAREAREMVVSPIDHATMLAAINEPNFRDLIELAWETGCRPQELRAIERRHVDLEGGRIVFPPGESKGKKKHRVIYLGTDKAREIVGRLTAANPDGTILRNSAGRPWTKDSINCAFCRLKGKTGTKFHMGAFRKGFVTEALKNGVDTVTLAHLVGHADSGMISRVYGRVQQDPEFMAAAARRARKAPDPANG